MLAKITAYFIFQNVKIRLVFGIVNSADIDVCNMCVVLSVEGACVMCVCHVCHVACVC